MKAHLAIIALFSLAPLLCAAADFDAPIDGGRFSIRADFIEANVFSKYYPELKFRIRNETNTAWRGATLRFDIGMICNGMPRQVSFEVQIGAIAGLQAVSAFQHVATELKDKVDGCTAEIIDGALIEAIRFPDSAHIAGTPKPAPEMTADLKQIEQQHETEAEQEAKRVKELQDRHELEVKQRIEREIAAETERQKALAEEIKLERQRDSEVRERCAAIYKQTSDKKVGDLTVKESQAVQACSALGIYRPR